MKNTTKSNREKTILTSVRTGLERVPVDCVEVTVADSNICKWKIFTCSSISFEFELLNSQKGQDIGAVVETATLEDKGGGRGGRECSERLFTEEVSEDRSLCFRRSAEPFKVFEYCTW